MNKKYKSDAFAAIHETVEGLYDIGLVDKVTMKEFDEDCLTVEDISPEEIRKIRTTENLSQPVFALYLNVSKNLISDWERGIKRPGGPALRLLSIIKNNGLDVITHGRQTKRSKVPSDRNGRKRLAELK